jgi:hypothetical protein
LATVVDELASLRWPGCGGLDDIKAPSEQVIDCLGLGGTAEPEALAQGLECLGILSGSQVEVAAKEQRRVPGPPGRCLRCTKDISRGEVGPVVGRVQVGDAELLASIANRDASKCHSPPLRPPGMDRQLPPLDDSILPVRFMWLTTT